MGCINSKQNLNMLEQEYISELNTRIILVERSLVRVIQDIDILKKNIYNKN